MMTAPNWTEADRRWNAEVELTTRQRMEPEPECTCEQTDVDLFDARGCELHNQATACKFAKFTDKECPF